MRRWAIARTLGEVDAVVDAEHERRVVDLEGGDAVAVAAQDLEHVGQVVLALGVVGAMRSAARRAARPASKA